MEVRDYNGTGKWSCQEVLQRYTRYTRQLRMKHASDLTPRQSSDGRVVWVYPVMDRVIAAIEAGDPAAIEIGIEFIHEDQGFPFGKILKSNTARALRRAPLTADQADRIRTRVVQMLLKGYVPHEYREYAKLLRRVGMGGWWTEIEERADRSNPHVRRYYDYFKRHVVGRASPAG